MAIAKIVLILKGLNMIRFYKGAPWKRCLVFLLVVSATAISADGDGKKHRHRERRHSDNDHYGEKILAPVGNATYADHCGACHFAYQPGLLPSESWQKILDSTADHFGETVDFDTGAREEISGYLNSNAANTSSSELSQKIMRCLDGRIPVRITNIPCIRKKHHEIPQKVVNRPSVGSWSNCIACHRTADRGVYDDDWVSIPN
jgi:mono/diheme cytochrome c family protein